MSGAVDCFHGQLVLVCVDSTFLMGLKGDDLFVDRYGVQVLMLMQVMVMSVCGPVGVGVLCFSALAVKGHSKHI